jgi:hypothetical protein
MYVMEMLHTINTFTWRDTPAAEIDPYPHPKTIIIKI